METKMFATFPELLRDLQVFNQWLGKQGPLPGKMETICRKVMNAMFLVEEAQKYPHATTADIMAGMHEMRAMDAYIDSTLGQLHGAVDVMAALITLKLHGFDKRPYSFIQLFDKSGVIRKDILQPQFTDGQVLLLEGIYQELSAWIMEYNDSKHNKMPDRMIIPSDYPVGLFEISQGLVPYYATAKDAHSELTEVRNLLSSAGSKICSFVAQVSW
ncbi:hypothetical protein [Alicyclobacillus mengziensis]|uniref:Uncharacterized protein n=1 Tax=Alicyclobacillus mengziensis TaxID=2931921 RepID=A0A9X7W138_9BACL|nr:hypothetical protein [Alicyclobacillus mengziensis]QSO48374.1 hypothetical protein JZ786_05140 [Alicyclobacillus mengziensis]